MLFYATALFAAFSVANAHMYLNTPQRFPSETLNSPLTSPLPNPPPEGSLTYPCQSQDYDFDFPRTEIAINSPYTLSFLGESVHGGGSCQVSLTTDLEPSKQSDFRVIHSIIGGCPARNQNGNLGADSSATSPDPYTYQFTIPAAINPGNYTLAWSWFNRIGNREMYMQCAPIEVTSGSSAGGKRDANSLAERDDTSFTSLPNMFLANIPDVPCNTPEAEDDLNFPDPGTSVERNVPQNMSPSWTTIAPLGNVSQCYKSNLLDSDSDSSGAASSFIASSIVALPTQFIASSAAAAPTQYATSTAAPPYPTGEPPAAPSSTGSTSTSSGSCPSGQTPCTAVVVCIGSDQFGLCNNGCAVAQDLAAGTTCSGGLITKRAYQPRGFGWYGYRLW